MNKENYLSYDDVEDKHRRSYRVERKFQGGRTALETVVSLVRAHC